MNFIKNSKQKHKMDKEKPSRKIMRIKLSRKQKSNKGEERILKFQKHLEFKNPELK